MLHLLYSDPSHDSHTTETLKRQLLPDRIIETIYHRNFDFCEGLPSKVCKTSLHFIKIDNLSLTDVLSDGMGSWRNLGGTRVNYRHETDGLFKVTQKSYKQPIERCDLSKDTLVLVKKYFRHSQHDDVRKFVVYVEDFYYPFVNNVVVVGYSFNNKEFQIIPKSHDNSKNENTCYTRKRPTEVKQVLEQSRVHGVGKALERHIEGHGGRASISAEDRPTKQQIYRSNSKTMEVDDFALIMEWAEENKAICRLVEAHPQPLLVLATDHQLGDLRRFATGRSIGHFSFHHIAQTGLQVNTHLGGYNVLWITYGTYSAFLGHI